MTFTINMTYAIIAAHILWYAIPFWTLIILWKKDFKFQFSISELITISCVCIILGPLGIKVLEKIFFEDEEDAISGEVKE